MIRGRFAPSPTGEIHLGNVWAMLLAWLDVRQRGGRFVLRIEDLDPDRSQQHYIDQLLTDLHWLGFDWDEGPDVGGPVGPYVQGERRDQYAQAIERLAAAGLVYACYCTRAEIRAAASAPHGPEQAAHCPGGCWRLPPEAPPPHLAGRKPALRVKIPPDTQPISFVDRCYGPQTEDVVHTAGDFVIRRADGVHAYQLAVVVDDGAMGITDVVRGSDLLDSSARQIWLHRMLGTTPPQFAHIPLLIDPEGHRLSKRQAALSVAALRAAGQSPETLIGWLGYWAGCRPTPAPARPADLIGALRLDQLGTGQIVVQPWLDPSD